MRAIISLHLPIITCEHKISGIMTGLEYVIFRTRWGYSGLVGTEKGVFRTCLPLPSRESVKNVLLLDIERPQENKSLLPGLQEKVKAYFKSSYVDFTGIWVEFGEVDSFSKQVLKACRKISYGQTVSYGQLAELAGSPGASRAVGNILGKNQVPLIVPCHRVVRSDGAIGGFSAAGGVDLKERMLKMEAESNNHRV